MVHLFIYMRRQAYTYTIVLGVMMALLFPTLFSSCSDDEKFTADKGAVLAFSQDTIKFDTVLVGVTSPTERFQVYNRNDKGVRISHVRLESGGTSGFKMNVDGRFGASLDDVEVLKKDSIFVFVEVTVPPQVENVPTLVEDAIIFSLESGIQQKIILQAQGQNVRVLKAETITTDRTLDNTLPYLVYDSLVVSPAATLTIEEGTTLYFHNKVSLLVYGGLEIKGTLEKPVTLRGDRTDKMFPYLPYDRLENQWGGISILPTCTRCIINYADIHSGNYGVMCDSIEGKIQITNTVIHNVGGYGLFLKDSEGLVANTQISNSRDECVSIFGGKVDFYHCTLAQFYPWGSGQGHALFVGNYFNEIDHQIEAVNFYNCFVTGYGDDEVYGNAGDLPFNLHFYHCVLQTDVSDTTYFHACTAESKEFDTYQGSNFKAIDTYNYIYDFHLDSLSVARGKGSPEYSKQYSTDYDGKQRGDAPDVGCYQY